MSEIFEEILTKDGRLVYKTQGTSMNPMLYQNRDLVILEVPNRKLQPDDVVLYKRKDQYILHRIISVDDLFYNIRGDNTYTIEKVPHEAVIGVLTAFIRKGRQYQITDKWYRCYVRIWCALYPVRKTYKRLRSFVGTLLRKIGVRK